MSIYGDIILDHYQSPRNNQKLPHPTHSMHVNNPLCGDELDFDVVIENEVIKDIGFSGQGCAIAIASSSLISEYVKGKKVKDIKNLKTVTVLKLLGIELSPNRLKCGLLAWEGIKKLVSDKEHIE